MDFRDFDWFSDNFMKVNSGKSHLLMCGTEATHANVNGSMIKSSQKEILLGINLDSQLNLKIMSILCVKKQVKSFMLLPKLHHSWI